MAQPAGAARSTRRKGGRSRSAACSGLWILLPIVGTFIWLAKTQNALSAFWEANGAVRP
jgi:hypothetical protein